ncbi:hypothetical protein ACFY2K_42900 [Kitasatospora sp. NPDC001309]|uniref:hypothetical protein n=1 Tax=Kitasatospora sp. NPDC001309 TaxID=3364013 RepID=UPI0036CBD935
MSTQRRALGTGPTTQEPTAEPSAGTRRLPIEAAVPRPLLVDVEHDQALPDPARRRPLGTGPVVPIGPDRP